MHSKVIGNVMPNPQLKQQGLFANQAFLKNEILIHFAAREILNEPNYLTVQINDLEHILLAPEYIQYVNHSCNPNVFFNTTTFQLEALKDIAEGDELTFFYPSTEWRMDQSFTCSCRSENCLKTVQGAYYLPENLFKEYRFADYIMGKLHQQKMSKRA